MTTKQNELQVLLIQEGVLTSDMSTDNNVSSPWYIKSLLAISGWLGALFILGFIFALFQSIIEYPSADLFISFLLFLSAYLVLSTPKNDFYEHLALACSLSGQVLLCVALFMLELTTSIWLIMGVLQLILVLIMPSFLHRLFSTIFAVISFEVFLMSIGLPYLLGSLLIFPMVWLSLHELNFVNQYNLMNGLLYGLVASVLILNGQHFLNIDLIEIFSVNTDSSISLPFWLFDVLFISAIAFSAWQLLLTSQMDHYSNWSKSIILIFILLAIVTLKAPGIMIGTILILLGFSHTNRVMIGLGVISLLFYSSAYYYMMEETLLFKSGLLFITALSLLLCRIALIKLTKRSKEKNSSTEGGF